MEFLAPDIGQRITVLAIPLAAELDSFKHSSIARRIHAWFVRPGNIRITLAYLCGTIGLGSHSLLAWALPPSVSA